MKSIWKFFLVTLILTFLISNSLNRPAGANEKDPELTTNLEARSTNSQLQGIPPYNMNPIWQYGGDLGTVTLYHGNLLAALGQRIGVYDLSQPGHMRLITSTDPLRGIVVDLEVQENYLYVLSQFIGLSNIPTCDLHVYDLADIEEPLEIGAVVVEEYSNNFDRPVCFDLLVNGSRAFVHQIYGITNLSITDPAAPQVQGFYSTGGNPWIRVDMLDIIANWLFLGYYDVESSGTFVEVLDYSNPEDPKLADFVYPSENFTGLGLKFHGQTAYSSNYDQLLIWNMQNPLAPVQISAFFAPNDAKVIDEFDIFGNFMYVIHQEPVLCDGCDYRVYLSSYDIQDPNQPQFTGTTIEINKLTYYEMKFGGSYLALGNQLIFSLSDPAIPQLWGSLQPQHFLGGSVIENQENSYISGSHLLKLDQSQPYQLNIARRSKNPGRVVAVQDNLIFVEHAREVWPTVYYDLLIYDVATPYQNQPKLISTIITHEEYYAIYQNYFSVSKVNIYTDFLYCTTQDGITLTFDIHDPFNPLLVDPQVQIEEGAQVKFGSAPNQPGKTFFYKAYNDPQDGVLTLNIYDTSDPSVWQLIGQATQPNGRSWTPRGMVIDDVWLVIHDGDRIIPIDISNVQAPEFRSPFMIGDGINDLAVQGDLVYVGFVLKNYLRIFHLPEYSFVGGYYPQSMVNGLTWVNNLLLASVQGDGVHAIYPEIPVQAEIGSSGGMLANYQIGIQASFPADVFVDASTVELRPLFPPELPAPAYNQWLVGPAFQIQIVGDTAREGNVLHFALEVPFEVEHTLNTDENFLGLYRLEDTQWLAVPGVEVDTYNKTVIAEVDQFGIYMVLGPVQAGQLQFLPVISGANQVP